LSPLDIERIFGLQNGCITHTSLALHQLAYNRWVSVPQCSQHVAHRNFFSGKLIASFIQACSWLQHASLAFARAVPLWCRLIADPPISFAALLFMWKSCLLLGVCKDSVLVVFYNRNTTCCRGAPRWRRARGGRPQLRFGGAE
jgi:hypothetical protein